MKPLQGAGADSSLATRLFTVSRSNLMLASRGELKRSPILAQSSTKYSVKMGAGESITERLLAKDLEFDVMGMIASLFTMITGRSHIFGVSALLRSPDEIFSEDRPQNTPDT